MNKKNNKEELIELNREIPQPIPFLDGIEQIKHTLKFLTQTGDVKYGIEILDDSLDFITPGTVTLISATPNTGKSLIAQIICNNIAKQGQKVMYCSCEMSAGQLMLREFVRTMGVTKRQLVEGYKTHPDSIVRILDIMEDKNDFDYLKNIIVQDIGSIHIDDLIKIYDDYNDFKYIIVDYVQNLKGDGADERNQFIDISKKLHNYAIRTGKSIIECAQIPKMTETEARTGKGIDFHKLRPMGSNQWEQDCDVLIKMAEDLEENQRYILINLYKNRLGGKKMITYKYIIDSRLNFVLQSRGV